MRKIGLLVVIFCLLMVGCGGDENDVVETIYDPVGSWEVVPTINCEEYDCYGKDCTEASAPSKYSMVIEREGDDLVVLIHYGGHIDGPYRLKHKVGNTYEIDELYDEDYIEKWELSITLNSDGLFSGREYWLTVLSNGEYCREENTIIGERYDY